MLCRENYFIIYLWRIERIKNIFPFLHGLYRFGEIENLTKEYIINVNKLKKILFTSYITI